MSDDKPFLCPVKDCGMQFTNEDHLNVHIKKHEMSLALNTGKNSNSPGLNFLDQTPTPTNFLKNCCEDINLFQELSKNPFDDAYKKALDPEVSPLPGPQSNELNTPTLILNDNSKYNTVTSLRNVEPLGPSPLARKTNTALDLSGKSFTVLQHHNPLSREAKAKDNCDHTSQVADSTSAEFPAVSSPSIDVREETEISSSSVPSVPQPISSPHSTTNSANHALLQTYSSAKTDDSAKVDETGVKEEPGADLTNGASSSQQQQCTMQVWLQLPSGQTVPISIPATINNMQMVGSEAEVQAQLPESPREVKPQVVQVVKGISPQPANPHLQPQTQVPVIQPAPSKVRTIATSQAAQNNTTLALKQRLKAQLQNQLSPTAKSMDTSLVSPSNSAFMPAAAAITTVSPPTQVFITTPSSSSPIMMIDSPGSEVNLSDSSDYSFDSKRQKMSPDSEDPKERRRKFLERNRAAAARCRQKRKHWIGNLERKADDLLNTNVRLQSDVKLLRGEVAHLKTLLLAHKDCPVTQQQRSSGQLQHVILSESGNFSSQELAQVVPTADVTSEPIQIGHQTIMTFVQEPVTGQQLSNITKQN